MTIEERLDYLEQRQKLIEEELMYCHKDIANLCDIIESLQQPEYHFHITYDLRSIKKDDLNNSINLEDYI